MTNCVKRILINTSDRGFRVGKCAIKFLNYFLNRNGR